MQTLRRQGKVHYPFLLRRHNGTPPLWVVPRSGVWVTQATVWETQSSTGSRFFSLDSSKKESGKEARLEIYLIQGQQAGHSSLQAPLDKSVLPCSLSPPTAQEAQTGSGRDDYPHPEILSSPVLGPRVPAKSNI